MNPFHVDRAKTPEPATVVIFGASGDLTKRKLVPGLYSLKAEGSVGRIAIVGYSRSEIRDDDYRDKMRASIGQYSRVQPIDDGLWDELGQSIFYHQGQFDNPDDFVRLRERIETIEAELGLPGNRLFYLATPPSVFAPIVENLHKVGLLAPDEKPFARVIIEKPFGRDLESARNLNERIRAVLKERQIFRIDHYLGKETVQNLLVFRFANGIFEPLWNNKYIDHVQITGSETLGLGGRGGYFDNAGILRDMVQNHLLQVVSLAAMEPPIAFNGETVRDEKVKVLQALRPIVPSEFSTRIVRGQYSAGSVLGESVVGYREEEGVNPDSRTETYVAMKLAIDNWRWAGVPFYLRSGKRMPKKVTEISIHFKSAPHRLFEQMNMADHYANVLSIRIQPDEGITLNLGAKIPGPAIEISPVSMEFRYASSFGVAAPEAYERLLLDSLVGDSTLFIREDEVEGSWSFITPIHEAWDEHRTRAYPYLAGTWGPEEAYQMLERDGRMWRRP